MCNILTVNFLFTIDSPTDKIVETEIRKERSYEKNCCHQLQSSDCLEY